MSTSIYLDYAASAPVHEEVVDAMAPFMTETFGNPSGAHIVARRAKEGLEDARDEIASLCGADPSNVIFTSGGTEADNLAISGSFLFQQKDGEPPIFLCSAIEHAAVLETGRALRAHGIKLMEASVTRQGLVTLEAFKSTLLSQSAPRLISIMAVNNEIGTIQPITELARLAKEIHPQALFHTDAVQAAPHFDLGPIYESVDMMTLSGHKLGGPKGIGVLLKKDHVHLSPMMHGGGQERDLRSGTQNPAGAIGMAASLRIMHSLLTMTSALEGRRDRFADALETKIQGLIETAPRKLLAPGHLHVRFEGITQEEMLLVLDSHGLFASGGAACASGALKPNHVLGAMGVERSDARTSIRFSFGHTTSDDDLDRAVEIVTMAVQQLRS